MEKGILNFCTLQSLRYNGLNLLTLIDQVKKIYSVKIAQLIPPLATSESLISWEVYMDFTEIRMAANNTDHKWMYAREFDPGVFIKMSYNENVLLCNLLAALIDCSKAEGAMPTFERPGPTYKGISDLRTNAKNLDQIGFVIVSKAHVYLRKQFSFRPESDIIDGFLADHEEEQKKTYRMCLSQEQLDQMASDLA